jgi:hypothetical protein
MVNHAFGPHSEMRACHLSIEQDMRDEASYVCDSCVQEIVMPIDLSAGAEQEYVEDCPMCCRPNVVHVAVEDDGELRVWASRE